MKDDQVIQTVTRFSGHCKHNKFLVDTRLDYIKCAICGEHLNPMWVVSQYADDEHRLCKHLKRLERLIEETKHKTKCKCEHCGEMTKIANQKEINKTYYG